MKRLILLSLMLAFLPHVAAAEVVIKLATLAPEGSQWHNELREMGEQWQAASNGAVKVKIYPGGSVGNESDMVRKLRVSQLQAALLTGTGIRDIEPTVQALQVPMLLKNYEELDYVLEKLHGNFEKAIEAKGYIVLNWGDAGWVGFFTQTPVKTPEQMKDIKVFAWSGDEAAVEAWKIAGFKPVVISSTDITTSLQTGMIQAVDTTPLAALSFQWYKQAKYLVDIKWAPLVGGTLISKATWNKIPADVQPKLMQIAHDIGEKMKAQGRKLNDDAIATMKKEGLQVTSLTDAEKAKWQAAAEKAYPYIREKVVPTAAFDEVKKTRDEFLKGKK